MAEDVVVELENPCCATWKKKWMKISEKCSKLEKLRNQFKNCTTLMEEKYNVVAKENGSLKQALRDLEAQVSKWKDEKENESAIRVDLEDEVSALNDEIKMLKQNGNSFSAPQEADGKLQERVNEAEQEINRLKDALAKEKERADMEKKNVAMERKKANDALKEVDKEKNKANEAEKVANNEKKKAEENMLLLEKLRQETDEFKSVLALERSKAEDAGKKLEAEKQKTIKERKRADLAVAKAKEKQEIAEANLWKANEYALSLEKLKNEINELKSTLATERSKSEAAGKKVDAEKQKTIVEKKRADLAVAKAQELRELAETNLKKARFEKDLADELNSKLEEEKNRVKKLEEDLRERTRTVKLVETDADPSNQCKIAEYRSDADPISQLVKMLVEKEQHIIKEKKRADLEMKRANKQRKFTEEHKRIATEEKHRADFLSRALEHNMLRLKELRKEFQKISYSLNAAGNAQVCSNIISGSETVKLLKKQLKLEKLLLKHAKKTTEVEVIRNNMLQRKLHNLKQDCLCFQQQLDMLDDDFLHDGKGIHELEKVDKHTFTSGQFYSDGCHGQLTSGIDSRLNPPCRGSKRKILQSSAMNSSAASFSDRPLAGSPERGTVSVITSAKPGDVPNLGTTTSRLSDRMRMRCNDNAVAEGENSIKSPLRVNAYEGTVEHSGMRGVLGAVASVENLYNIRNKLHQQVPDKLSELQFILNCQKDDTAKGNLQEDFNEKDARPFKRRKTSSDGTVVINPLHDSCELMPHADINDSDARVHVPPVALDIVSSDQHLKGGIYNTLGSNQGVPADFDDMAVQNYMKLLDLDNAADESSYLRAIASPLSPTLPEIEFHGKEAPEIDNAVLLVDQSLQEGLSTAKDDNLARVSSCDIIEAVNTTYLVVDDQKKDKSVDILKNREILQANDAHFHQIQVSGDKLGASDVSESWNDKTDILCERTVDSTQFGHLQYFVISSHNKDSHSILKIFETICSCMPKCSLFQSADVYMRSLLSLLNAEDISPKERVCVFFSMMLHAVSINGTEKSTNVLSCDLVQSVGSITHQIQSAFSDQELRSLLMESCDFLELLALIDDFLQQRKVLSADTLSAKQGLSSPKINLILNGNNVMLFEYLASGQQLVAASCLLASLCSTFNHIGFLCETSCNIFSSKKFDTAMILAVLHTFADACGTKFFTLGQYQLAMTVVKSVVVFLEKQILSTNSPSHSETPSKTWSCNANCPFFEGALSVEAVVSLLIEKLQMCGRSICWPQDARELVNSLVSRVCSHEERIDGDSITPNNCICSFVDILSLFETIASFMGWKWTNDNIIGQLRELLESHLMEDFSVAVFVVLGQLGRVGVDACGYEDSGIQKLREWLSKFVSQSNFSQLRLPVQFAIVTALLGLTPIKFKEIVESKDESPATMTHLFHADFIRKWFSLLSNEQQSFLRSQQASSDINTRISSIS